METEGIETHYYRLNDPLENLKIRVTLRKLSGAWRPDVGVDNEESDSKENQRSKENQPGAGNERPTEEGAAAPAASSSSSPPPTSAKKTRGGSGAKSKTLKWQEKVFGPREVARYSYAVGAKGRHDDDDDDDDDGRGWSIKKSKNAVDREYYEKFRKIKGRTREGLLEDEVEEVMIYTYVDKDGYVPPSELSRPMVTRCLDLPEVSPLAESVVTLPKRRDKSHDRSRLVSSIQSHLTREAPFKTMYIMAAVDVKCNPHENRRRRHTYNPFRGRDPEDELMEGEEMESGVRCHEQVLATIKLHKSGALEMKPGFSEAEAEEGDEGKVFLSEHSLKKADQLGERLRSYRFTSARGNEYEYVIENLHQMMAGGPSASMEQVHHLLAEEILRDKATVESRRNRALFEIAVDKPGRRSRPYSLHTFVEIVSATGFEGGPALYVEYEVHLRDGWIWKKSRREEEDDRERRHERRQREGIEKGEVEDEEEEEDDLPRGGITQVAYATLPPPTLGSRGKGYTETLPPYVSTTNPVLGVFILILTAAALFVGLDWILWVPLAILVLNGSSTFQLNQDMEGSRRLRYPLALFGHLTSLAMAAPRREKGDADNDDPFADDGEDDMRKGGGAATAAASFPRPWPGRIFFQVSSLQSMDRHRLEGYGILDLPATPGTYDYPTIRTWRPVPSLRARLRDFMMGGVGILRDLAYIGEIQSGGDQRKGVAAGKYGFQTETSGELKVRLHVIEQRALNLWQQQALGRSLGMNLMTRTLSGELPSGGRSTLNPILHKSGVPPVMSTSGNHTADILHNIRMRRSSAQQESGAAASSSSMTSSRSDVKDMLETMRARRAQRATTQRGGGEAKMMGSSSPSHGGGGGEERNPLLASDGKDVEEGDDPAHFSDTKPLL